MYVRLAFGVAAHLEPEILIVDEVLAVGDVEFQKKAIGKMQDVSRGEGRTVLFVSHSMASIRQLCTRCLVMNHGGIVFDGTVEAAVQSYVSQNATKDLSSYFKKQIIESKAIELIEAEILGHDRKKQESIQCR